ncbi:hypothetical protein [Maribacter sp. 2210JD10-5]|uniref:hypothetical protein n=1 Tax=Maribacter sp. 2210JD10-5 TaxID=3386272 RepID=UPI0039BC86BF
MIKSKKEIDRMASAAAYAINVNSYNVMQVFEDAFYESEDAFYERMYYLNKLFAYCYISSDNVGAWSETIDDFIMDGMDLSVMNPREVAIFKNLPDNVTIYRGADKKEAKEGYGISWSLCPKVAKRFAFNHRNHKGETENRTVHKLTIPKHFISCYFGSRKEKEVLISSDWLAGELK